MILSIHRSNRLCLAAGACLLGLASPAESGGITLMTHGFNGDIDDWIIPVTGPLNSYPGFPGEDLSCYRIDITESGSELIATATHIGGPEPLLSDSGEIFIKLDWSVVSLGGSSSGEVAEVAAAALLSTSLITETGGRALAELPIHLIGHSRGASVISEMARQLGAQGIWVDQMTALDPVPVGAFGDTQVEVWQNVLFADNYYQTIGGIFDPKGSSLNGAYNRQLNSLDGGYGSEHSDVHLWYHGTIETSTPASDSIATIEASQRSSWWTAAETAGINAGFLYSRIGGGDRLSTASPAESDMIADGMNQLWEFGAGTSSNRSSLPSPLDPWPNVITLERGDSGPLEAGSPLGLSLRYQSEASPAGLPILEVFLDPDSNPWNGNEIELGHQDLTGSGFSSVLSSDFSPLVPLETEPGTYAIGTRIREDGKTRYHYLGSSLELTAASQAPVIVSGSIRFEAGLMTFSVSGTAGQQVDIQASPSLLPDSWQSIATPTLTSEPFDFSDPESTELARRFYRIRPLPDAP